MTGGWDYGCRAARKKPAAPPSLILFLILVTLSNAHGQTPATQPIRPSFGVLLSPGICPCAIHVDGLRFPLNVGTPLTAQFDWNFGDPKSRFNNLTGFNAAHLYTRPGRYTITLTVTDETGNPASATATLVISPDTRRRFYVSPEGSDANTGWTEAAPFRSLSRAFKTLVDNSELSLKAGAKYESNASLQISHRNIVIGRYDSGSDPIVSRIKGNGSSTFSIGDRCDGVTIEHITFDSPYPADPKEPAPKLGIGGIHAAGRNVAVCNCTFLNMDDAVNANGSPQGLLVQDCSSPLVTGLRGYFIWGQGSDLVCLGNTVANSTREHNVRVSGQTRVLVAENHFTNLDRRPADKGDESKGCIEIHKASFCYVAHNTVTSGPIRVGPLGLNEDPSTATDWVVIDGNTVQDSRIFANSGSHHIMIRNNIIRNDHDQAMIISGPDKQGRTSGDLTIINNTAINNSDTGAFLKLWGHVDGIILKNNLFIAPGLKPGTNGTSAVNTAETDLSSFTEIERNIWPAPSVFSGKTKDGVCVVGQVDRNPAAWSQFPQVKEDRFNNIMVNEAGAPAVESVAVGFALPTPGLRYDHDGKPRSPGAPTVGALEVSQESATTQPTLQNGSK
jgi:PKD repeat protein